MWVVLPRSEQFGARESLVPASVLGNQATWGHLVQPKVMIHIHQVFLRRLLGTVAHEPVWLRDAEHDTKW